MKTLVVVIDQVKCECLYADGKRWSGESYRWSEGRPQDGIVSAGDIAEASAGQPVTIALTWIDYSHFFWPDTLEEATEE